MANTEEFRKRSAALMPLATVEHHLLRDRSLSVFGIGESLVAVQDAVLGLSGDLDLDHLSVMEVNKLVTDALGQQDGVFEQTEQWQSLIGGLDDGGGFASDPSHASGWIFSALYWDHLSVCQFASAWFFTNAVRDKYELPPLQLAASQLGSFLESLSSAGPPIHDGQTFFPDRYRL